MRGFKVAIQCVRNQGIVHNIQIPQSLLKWENRALFYACDVFYTIYFATTNVESEDVLNAKEKMCTTMTLIYHCYKHYAVTRVKELNSTDRHNRYV